MKTRNKIFIIVIIIFAVIIVASFVIQYLMNKQNQKNLNEGLNEVSTIQFTTDNSDHVNQVVNQAMTQPVFSEDQKIIHYLSPNDNSLYTYNLETKKNLNLIPLLKFDPIISAVWSPDKKNVFITTQKAEELTKNVLVNLEKKSQSPLPETFQNVIWQDNENLVAYNFQLDTINEMTTYNINNQQTSNIIQFQDLSKQYYLDLIYVNSDSIYYLIGADSNAGTKSLYKVDLRGVENIAIMEDVIQAKIENDSIISQKYIEGNSKYYLNDLAGQNEKELNIEVFSIDNLMKNKNNLFWIKSRYTNPEGNLGISYEFIQTVNLENLENNNSIELVNVEKEGFYSSNQFFLANDESKIYFINSANSYLYSINLK